jgi:hypothetical protein
LLGLERSYNAEYLKKALNKDLQGGGKDFWRMCSTRIVVETRDIILIVDLKLVRRDDNVTQ